MKEMALQMKQIALRFVVFLTPRLYMVVMMCTLFTGFCGFPLHNKLIFATTSNNYYIDLLYNCVPLFVCSASPKSAYEEKGWASGS
jgi:hypothetical protein